jgi:Carboxypeptidase regulatory-like domain
MKKVTVTNGVAAPIELEFIPGVTLYGRITREGNPLARATIRTSGSGVPHKEVLTRADGTYEVPGLLPGEYDIFVVPDDRRIDGIDAVRVTVGPSGSVYDRDFTEAAVRGRVIDANGQPLPDVTIGALTAVGQQMVATDSDGRFLIEHVEKGRVQVNARKNAYVPVMKMVSVANGRAEVEIILTRAQATLVRVVDARDDSLLDAFIQAHDALNHSVEWSHGSRTGRKRSSGWVRRAIRVRSRQSPTC